MTLSLFRRAGIRYSNFSYFLFLVMCCSVVVSCSQENDSLLPEESSELTYGMVAMNTANDAPNVILNLDKITWDKSNVYKAMYNGIPIAEICKEYIITKRQAIVVYPIDENGIADITKGFVAQVIEDLKLGTPDSAKIHGGSVSFSLNVENTICRYTQGSSAPYTLVYINNTKEIGGAVEATCMPFVITDTDLNSYGVVKIGTQYWMRENLNACYYVDGAQISDSYSNGDYGRLYSWGSVKDRSVINGWNLATNKEWYILKRYLSLAEAGLMMKSATGWNDYNGVSGNGTNISGFNGFPAGMYDFENHCFISVGGSAYWWSSDSLSNRLSCDNTKMLNGPFQYFSYYRCSVRYIKH